MNTVNRMTRWQAFVWLWRHDAEAKWFWLWCAIKGCHLRDAVKDNYRDFGLTDKGDL